MKGLMDRCLNREAALECVRAKAEQTEDELGQLHKWKSTMEKKFNLSEQARKELEQKTDEVGKALEIKEKEIQDLKKKLRQAKVVAVRASSRPRQVRPRPKVPLKNKIFLGKKCPTFHS